MKIKVAVLKNVTSIGELGLNGIRTLGAGNIKNLEILELAGNCILVKRNNASALIPLEQVSYLLVE